MQLLSKRKPIGWSASATGSGSEAGSASLPGWACRCCFLSWFACRACGR